MLIPLRELTSKYPLRVTGVLHVGAHLGEEAEAYCNEGWGQVTWVEGNPALISKLNSRVRKYGHRVIQSLVSDKNSAAHFAITNNGESSSLLPLGTHMQTSPHVHVVENLLLPTMRLDALIESYGITFNFLNLDLQGAELMALRGLGERLSDVDYIYTEVNKKDVYQGCAKVEELDRFLTEFTRVETLWCEDGGVDHGWGDAFYIRSEP